MKQFALLITAYCLLLSSNSTAQSSTGSFTYDGVLRDYILNIPPGYNAANPAPLTLNLHGYTSNAAQQVLYTQFNTQADAAGYIVVYPNGIGNAWNSGWNVPYFSGIDDVGFLSALIDTVSAHYAVDPCRVYSTGMSNGGFMSYRLACELENKIAAVASVTGSMTDSMQYYCQNTRAIAVMEMHGTADPTVAYNGTNVFTSVDENFAFWAARNNCVGAAISTELPNIDPLDGTTVTKMHYTTCDDSTELITFKINGGAHTWPGAAFNIGVTTMDINANVEILKFFNEHPKCGSITSSVKEINKEELFVFPNPVENELTINSNLQGDLNLSISDITGKVIYSDAHFKDASAIQTSSFTAGIYYLQIADNKQQMRTKFIKN